MAFLFKSKNKDKDKDRALQSREGPPGSGNSIQSAASRIAREEKHSRSTPTGSLNSLEEGTPSPDVDKFAARRGAQQESTQLQTQSQQQQQQLQQQPPPSSDLPFRNAPPPPQNMNASLYPWSQRRLNFTASIPSPFPRYGAAVNSVSSKEGDIYVMGGLINSSTVKGDLWMIEAGQSMACYPLATTSEGPGPRVGHASLLVGNAFIVYGGDTKIDEADVLDETLYLLNTSTRQWSRALPAGARPSGRYGHSLNIIGSKIYIFGGQVEGYFMNDLASFDLNQLQMPNNRWEVLIDNNEPTGPMQGKIPPARTNHSMITYNDKMYLFGGTNGFQWFNDVWCYDPAPNTWTQLPCIGYIPIPREGHAAALVDDVMYSFGGRTEEGTDLGDLAAFRISTRRWYTFQNMGPTPSPRSGHSMTAVGKLVVVVGGEPSSATNQVNDLSLIFVLDTSKIRYPNDAQIQSNTQKVQQGRRPSGESAPSGPPSRGPPSRENSSGPDPKRLAGGPSSPTSAPKGASGFDMSGPPPVSNGISKLPRIAGPSTPSGPPPQGQPPRPTVDTSVSNRRVRNASLDRIEKEVTGVGVSGVVSRTQSPIARDAIKEVSPVTNGRRTPNQQVAPQVTRSTSRGENAPQVTRSISRGENASQVARSTSRGETATEALKSKTSRQTRGQSSVDSNTEPTLKTVANRPPSPPPPTRQPSNPLSRRGSNRNSQMVALLKELDSARNRNAWYASELELARKAGYASNATLSPGLESRSDETFDDEDKQLIEALLVMRQELVNVQSSVDKQAILAAKQIAESERQRDAAVREAIFAKAKTAAHSGSAASTPSLDNERGGDSQDRSAEMHRKLASALGLQKELQTNLARVGSELEAERRARQLADETSNAAQKRMADLEAYKQENSSEIEQLRAELHLAQRDAREQSIAAAEAIAATSLLRVEKDDFEAKYNEASGNSREHSETFESLRKAVAVSSDIRNHLERKFDEERTQREMVESKMTKLKAEHEARTAELVAVSQRLRDTEEIAERHAAEANAHRQAVLSGLDKIQSDPVKANGADMERMGVLQDQVNVANSLVRKYQQEADAVANKLRKAEERIAGLEAYQEQSSREGVTIRRQLQSALRDTQSLQAMNSDLKHQLSNQQLEANAIMVQHNTLKDILSERGISPSNTSRVRGKSARTDSPDVSSARTSELEQQLARSVAAHEETKQGFNVQLQETEEAYRVRITQLEHDYQSAVHYVKGTEKMLKKMKEELAKHKSENSRLKNENLELEERSLSREDSADWAAERESLEGQIESLEHQVQSLSADLDRQLSGVRKELDSAKHERDFAVRSRDDAVHHMTARERELGELQQENGLLEKRAQDAEHKVSLLLDQVESSVDNYRRRSRMSSDHNITTPNMNGVGHNRQESSEAGSLYGGGMQDARAGMGEARNSMALDNLANELDMLRSHWETTNKNYRLSNTFDFEGNTKREDDGAALGLSESLADWRKRLDTEEQGNNSYATKGNPGP
ncbi:Uu.00g117630.m01.CDS01 [Anthostomella pinea]|uniref:Uu.00g117630.m01.CDS01 n=1 Tax=Anthostomella pinea TaxID=933095 RepID=A0AAI8VG80_9PEZI|nr:Uu.00g117630.m01.CDS01 [Anthostomella pinea]